MKPSLRLPLLPRPKKVLHLRGSFDLRIAPPIVLTPRSNDSDFASAVALRKGLARQCGIELSVETHARVEDLGPRIELHRRGAR